MEKSKLRFRLRDALIFTALLSAALLAYRSWPLDGIEGIVFGFADDTVWADGYSDNLWHEVRLGIKRDEVYALLGEPLDIRTTRTPFDFDTLRQGPGEIVECWTRTPNNSSYHVRQIAFKGDLVVAKENQFYFD
jgi:hypothetical protein